MRLVAISSIVILMGACSSPRRVPLEAQDGVAVDAQLQDASPPTSLPDAAVARDLESPDGRISSDVRVWPDATTPDMPVTVPDATIPDVTVPDFGPNCVHPPVVANCNNNWCSIPAGCFMMGSPPDEPCRESCYGKETQHTVVLTHDFEIAATEVTKAEFLTLMGFDSSPPSSCGPTCPAASLSWYHAAAYCNALSSKAGLGLCYSCNGSGAAVTCTEAAAHSGGKIYSCPGYRLPTDAEWEYAYRAGSTTTLYPTAGNDGTIASCSGDPNANTVGWNSDNSTNVPHPVGTKPPNAWGLFGMAGNAHEWCHDRWQPDLGSSTTTDPWGSASGSDRVLRSGSWICPANEMRAACRFGIAPTITQNVEFGFRPCRTLFP